MKLLRNTDLIIGVVIGIIVMFSIYFISSYIEGKNANNNEQKYPLQTGAKIDSIQVGNYKIEIKQRSEVQIKEHNQIIDEKIKSFNDRIGDLYLSFGIIIALLLAIVAGVFFKTETEVAKHMNKNYGEHKKEIEKMAAQAQSLLAEIKTSAELSQQITPKQQLNQDKQEVNDGDR
jgi:uncharacterized membrane protein YraQ (UPF0718 family)